MKKYYVIKYDSCHDRQTEIFINLKKIYIRIAKKFRAKRARFFVFKVILARKKWLI